MAICNKNHRYNERLKDLPDGQGGDQRHKCAGCAYELGQQEGRNGKRNPIDWSTIDDSQAGAGRHKDAEDAYIVGYADGARDIRTQ